MFDSEKVASLTRQLKSAEIEVSDQKKRNADKDHLHSLAIAKLQADQSIALKEKEFELKHFKDEEMKKAQDKLIAKEQENAVLKKENEMLVKITDLNADVIDVKDLVNNLIEKLPTVNLTSLTVQSTEKK